MYLLDANAFMEASRLYYAFDIAPGFWTWLETTITTGDVASVSAIRDEITTGRGPLVDWATRLPKEFWLADDETTVAEMTRLSRWAAGPTRRYTQAAIDAFLASADLRLIAHAAARGATVVTRERPAPEAKKTIQIPDACNAHQVAWTDPFTTYRQLGLRLVS